MKDHLLLLIDNYDSFTFNLAQYLGELGHAPVVHRNDEITLGRRGGDASRAHRDLARAGPSGRRRHHRGRDPAARATDADARASASGTRRSAMPSAATVVRAPSLMHGKTSSIQHDGRGVFSGVSQPFVAGRYHSLIVADPPPEALGGQRARPTTASSWACGIATWPVHGVQFHPESVLTGEGRKILRNFLELECSHGLIDKLQRRVDLTVEEAAAAMETIMDGQAQPSQIAGLPRRPGDERGASRRDRRPGADDAGARGEVESLVRAGVRHLRHRRRRRAHLQRLDRGGAGAGRVRRAGRQARQPQRLEPLRQRRSVRERSASTSRRRRPSSSAVSSEAGIAFLFAQMFHPSMKHAAPTRRELGVRTAFNLLGPLTNPAGATRQLVGVPRPGADRARRALAGAARRRARLGRARRRRPRRDLDHRLHEGVGVPGRRRQHLLSASGRRRPAARLRRRR